MVHWGATLNVKFKIKPKKKNRGMRFTYSLAAPPLLLVSKCLIQKYNLYSRIDVLFVNFFYVLS